MFSWLGWHGTPNSFFFLLSSKVSFGSDLPPLVRGLSLLQACVVRSQSDLWAGRIWVFPFLTLSLLKFPLSPVTVVNLDSWFPRPKEVMIFLSRLVLCVCCWASFRLEEKWETGVLTLYNSLPQAQTAHWSRLLHPSLCPCIVASCICPDFRVATGGGFILCALCREFIPCGPGCLLVIT